MSVVFTSSPQGWLTVTPDSGHSPLALTVTVNPTSLTPGSYSGTITINTVPAGSNPAVDRSDALDLQSALDADGDVDIAELLAGVVRGKLAYAHLHLHDGSAGAGAGAGSTGRRIERRHHPVQRDRVEYCGERQ